MRDTFERVGRWLISLVFVGIAAYLLYGVYKARSPLIDHLDTRLPFAFHAGENLWVFWGWVLGLGALGTVGFVRARGQVRAPRFAPVPEAPRPDDDDEAYVDFWPPGSLPSDPVYLFLSAAPGPVADLWAAVELESRATSVLISEPSRAVLVNVARLPGGSPRVCRALVERRPEEPPLRGIYVVVPYPQLLRPEQAERRQNALTVRSELGAIRRALRLEAPVFLTVTGLEAVPDFLDLSDRLGRKQAEWGVTLTSRRVSGSGEPEKSLLEFWGKIHKAAVNQMAKSYSERLGNLKRFTVLRLLRAQLTPAVLEFCGDAFPTAGDDPVDLRGIDLVAAGKGDAEQHGALFAVYGRAVHYPGSTHWTPEALRVDRVERRRAWRTATLTGAVALGVWLYVDLWLGSFGAAGVVATVSLAAAWFAALMWVRRRWPDAEVGRA